MKTAKIFMNGRSQAIRLPKEFRFSGEEVFVKKEGDRVVLIPKNNGWDYVFKANAMLQGDFPDRDQPMNFDEREPID
jgi:antitoxin VapB